MSIPEESYLKRLDTKETIIKSEELGKLCKKIYEDCYNILHNLSFRINETNWKDITKYKMKIEKNVDLVDAKNLYNDYELY